MQSFTYFRTALVTSVLVALALSLCTVSQHRSVEARNNARIATFGSPASATYSANRDSEWSTTESLRSKSNYYRLRNDIRRCAFPLCGGYFVRSVNQRLTRCANNLYKNECYVAEIDWNSHPEVDSRKLLVRGNILAKKFSRFGNLGALRVIESWEAASEKNADGTFFHVKDRGIRCITSPCLTHREITLNSNAQRFVAGVDLKDAGANEDVVNEANQMLGVDGILVAGSHATVTGPAGRALELKANQFYLRASKEVSHNPPNNPPNPNTPNTKPCIKTGCSNQVCADENVMTTCEWRSEYACYQKARCERQANGKCGFTMTPELTACLKRARP